MSDGPLLITKITPPLTRDDWVSRPELSQQLENCPGETSALLCAPAGYGKTVLLSQWAAQTSSLPAWVSLDAGDNDRSRFLTYCAASIQSRHDLADLEPLTLFSAPGKDAVEHGLITLINTLQDQPAPITLVLDDYQAIRNPAVHGAVTFLIDNLPSTLRVFIATRADPPLPLARWKSRSRLLEIRADRLRFTMLESHTFLQHSMAANLDEGQLRELHAKTEGWISGLRLGVLSLQHVRDPGAGIHSLSGASSEIAAYLTSEVLRQLPPDTQRFLLETSILEKLCAPLCSHLTGLDGQKQLEKLAAQNLFLEPLDSEGTWYRYHSLFSELLRFRLQRFHPEKITELHRQASAWFSAEGWFDMAALHASQAANDTGTAALLERHINDLWERGEFSTILRWGKSLPMEILEHRIRLAVYISLALIMTGELREGILRLEEMKRVHGEELQGETAGWLAAGFTYAAYSQRDMASMQAHAERALALLPASSHHWRGGAAVVLANAKIHEGDFPAAEEVLQQAETSALASDNRFLLLTTRLYRAIACRGETYCGVKASASRPWPSLGSPLSPLQARFSPSGQISCANGTALRKPETCLKRPVSSAAAEAAWLPGHGRNWFTSDWPMQRGTLGR